MKIYKSKTDIEIVVLDDKRKPISAVLIMVCGYIFLVIERPWESIRYLQGLQIERAYAVTLILVAFILNKFKLTPSPTNKWIYNLLALHFVLAPFAFSTNFAVEQGIEYAKMVVLYLLMLSVAEDEHALKLLVKAYVVSTMLYALHSLWEYFNGRHVWRMGIARMVGVDSTFNDPNAFGATMVLSLPFVYVLLRSETNNHFRWACYLYFVLAIACVVLTGSRTSFTALLVLSAIWVLVQQGWRKVLFLIAVFVALALVWNIMPEEKRSRFSTLWDEDAGSAAAKASADGRMIGWAVSLKMFSERPLTGVGAGGKNFIGYRVENGLDDGTPSANQSHVLYGEVLAELGLFGAALFLGLIFSIWRCCRWARSSLNKDAEDDTFLVNLAGAILTALLLLLVFGIGGHNFYRPLWLWLAAWSGSIYMFTMRKVECRFY